MSDAQPNEPGPDPTAIRKVLGDALGYLYPAALRAAVRIGVAELLAAGPRTPQQLAESSGVDAEHLSRLLRFLATREVFVEDGAGAFHVTPAADLLRPDAQYSIRSTVLLLTDEIYWRSAGQLETTVRNGKTVFNDIFGSSLFDYLASNDECAQLFHTGIADLSVIEQGGIAESYRFPETGTVVDVGGGPGGFLHAVLSRNPQLRGILFDQEAILREHRLDDPAIAGRWETVGGDFFTTVPPSGDIYLLKRVLHDWDDAASLRILQCCRQAMPDQARVLIIDAIIPTGNDPHPSKLYDIAMMTIFDGKERTEVEFADLLSRADLKPLRIIPTPGTLSIIEAVAI